MFETMIFPHVLLLALITMLSGKIVNGASLETRQRTIADKNLYHNVNLEEEKVEVNELKPNDPKQLRFEVHAFGEDLKLVLHRNAQLVTPQAQVIRRHNSRTVSWERVGDYYTGYIQSRTGSSVAVKVNNGSLSGVIITHSYVMTIYPSNEHLHHVITRRKHENSTLPQADSSLFNISHSTRTKRSTSNNRYVELMLVADRYTTETYGDFTEQYLLSVAYLLNAVMQDDTIGDIKVIYTIVKVMIISGYEKGLDITENEINGAVAYLSLFATWVSQFNTADDNDPKHFDQAILITKRVCGLGTSTCYENGRGYFGEMCSKTRSVASAIAAGLSAGLTAAHETGHNFGLSHDSGDCSNGYIMHTALAAGKNAFSWSSCSRDKLQSSFRDRSKFSCLNDVPAGLDPKESVSVVNLAMNYSGDDQCRLMYGNDFGHCAPLKSNCKILYCRKTGANVCVHRSTPPLEGTECGTYKWCRNGVCVDKPIPDPIDGQWSSWSTTFSNCTRSCGMGVRHRSRTCDNPSPEYFGKDCEGDSKGHYETCNTQDCPAGTDSYRLEQCKEKDPTFNDYLDEEMPCILRCREGNIVKMFTTTLKDGTLCSKYKDERDVCVLGQCTKVGCDRTFNRTFYDRCRVCSGDGSTCRLVKSSYKTVHRQYGGAVLMFTLPVGSANLLIQETSATFNNIGDTFIMINRLGLKDQNDNWIIGENTGTSTKYAAGSRITYERAGSKSAEKLLINGPTTEQLKVMSIYWFEHNVVTPYEYYERLSTPDTTPLTFAWKFTLSECSETCAGGVKTKITTCHRTDDETEVGIQFCDSETEPTNTVACNTQACDPSWETDVWRSCSADCGPNGTRSRPVECRQKIRADVTNVLGDSQCTGNKPVSSEPCNRKDCDPDWVPGEWSTCSKNKCEGIQTRSLSCKKLLVSGEILDLTNSDCTSVTPLTELVCNDGVHCYEWRPVYPDCSECRDYFTYSGDSGNTGGSRYKSVGCYKMNSKPFGAMLTKLTVNNANKTKTVAECGRVAWARARRVFAVRGNGECYSSMDGHHVYHKDGQAKDCTDDLIGGADSVYVYALTGKALLSTPTCYSVEDDVQSQSSLCESLAPKPPPEMKVCCEEMCKDNCYKTKDGTYCAIPFIYKGKTYYECTKNENGIMWCATTSNFDMDDKGADCEQPCRQSTTSGDCCTFPFIYRGRLYNTCITANSANTWCSLTSNYDRDRLRGTCV